MILAHDSFTQLGGAEKVMDIFHEMFPDAPVFTLVLDKKLADKYSNWDIKTSWLQKIYNIYSHFQHSLPLIPWAVDSLKINSDKQLTSKIILSSSSSFIKAINKPSDFVHVNYCHTPTRFLWSDADYVNQETPSLLRPFAKLFLRWMKKWDYAAAQRVDFFIANSKEVQKRIKEFYHRDSVVVYPPIDTDFFHPTIAKSNYFLLAGRLQAHKKNELIIQLFNELKLPLHVVGSGRQEGYLRGLAGPNITFYGRVGDHELRDQYSGALALVYPQIEDFGLMPLEAAACGTASIGIAKGGSLETIIPGVTGELFENYSSDKIKNLILNWNPQKYSVENLRQLAEKFSKEKFKTSIMEFLNAHN